jgi:DHA2 family multidrug resistance protein
MLAGIVLLGGFIIHEVRSANPLVNFKVALAGPLAGLMLRRSDPRLVASIGFIFVSIAGLMVAYGLTPIWGSDQFLPSQLLQAVGQSFALSGVLFFSTLHLRPQDALTFGGAVQVARLLGGEVGTAFVTTCARVRGR